MGEPAVAEPVGSYLAALRAAKGCSLEEMARATRVSVGQLEALEAERWSDLPAPIFVKGFIRAYCQVLGETPDEALGRYRRALGEPPGSPTRPVSRPPTKASWRASPIFISLVLLGVFGGGLLALNLVSRRLWPPAVAPSPPSARVERAAPPPAPVPVPVAEPASPPAPPASPTVEPATASARAGASMSESGGAQRLVLKAIEPTWIRVEADEGQIVEELLPAGATREWTAEKRFVLTVGNAGGIELTLNGHSIPPLGARGAVIRRLELPPPGSALGS